MIFLKKALNEGFFAHIDNAKRIKEVSCSKLYRPLMDKTQKPRLLSRFISFERKTGLKPAPLSLEG